MSDRIVEITEMMQNRKNMENDMSEAMEMVRDLFRERYLSGIQNAAKEHHKSTLSNPPREVALCNVLKEFSPPENHEMLNKMSDMLLMMHTAKSIHSKISMENYQKNMVSATKFGNHNNMIHSDGIYEMDQQCLRTNNNSLPITELMLFMALANE